MHRLFSGSMFTHLSISLFTLLFLTTGLFSQLTNYRGEMNIRVKNGSSTAVNNTQILLRVNTQALITLGLMQNDGDDIRFGSNCTGITPLQFWLEGYMNTDSTKIWVKIPFIAGNDSIMIYMFFGNPAATSNSDLLIFNGPHSSTDSVATGSAGGVANSQRGFRFSPIVNVLVTHFGKREPTGTTRYVTLFDVNSQQVLRQTQVSGGAGQYYYGMLATPIWLNQGVQYIIELFQGTGDGYYFGTSSQIGQHLTYYDMKYCNSCTQNTFPTSTLTNYHYGYPDFWYFVRDNVVTPEPTQVNFPPADTNTPPAPTNLTGVAGNQQVTLRWNKNTQFDIYQYILYRNTTNNPGTATMIGTTNQPDTDFVATGLTNGTAYYFWVRASDWLCNSRISAYSTPVQVTPLAIIANGNEIPKVFALFQNYPNPFNPVTNINFDIPKGTMVRLTVYDVTGREVDVLVNQFMAPGSYKADWDAADFASGIYFYKIEAGSFVDRKKMVVLK